MWRALLLAILLVGGASAHVPSFADGGGSPATAFHVADPDQSRVFYGQLAAGAAHWFQFERQDGDAIDVSVHLPAREPERPALWIVGPGMEGEGPPQTPPGLGGQLVPRMDDLGIEPFTPLAMRGVANWNGVAGANGTYFVAIIADADTTYSVAIGAGESFTALEWLAIPVQRPAIMAWAGIPWPVALWGEVLAATAALVVGVRKKLPLQQVIGFVAAAVIAGTAFTTLGLAVLAAVQGGVSAALIVPLVFAGLAFAFGFGAYRAVRAGSAWAGLAWAVAGLALWAGLIVGPLALVVWSFWRMRSNISLHAT